MKKDGISESEMAKRMKTSRSQLERLVDPDNPNVLLENYSEGPLAKKAALLFTGAADEPCVGRVNNI